MKRLAVPSEWAGTVSIVEEISEEEARKILTPDETAKWQTFPRPKRRHEWAASRVAAKLLAVESGLCESYDDCSIVRTTGKPRLKIPGQDLQVSISHSEGVGAAAISRSVIGIDLQKTRPLKPRIVKFFLNPDELDLPDRIPVDSPLIHLWCVKESIMKVRGHGWYKEGYIRLESAGDGGLRFTFSTGKHSGIVETRRLESDFVLAVARVG